MRETTTKKPAPHAAQGMALKKARENLQKTQAAILEGLGIHKPGGEGLIQNWERGVNRPRPTLWPKLSVLLGIDVAALYLGSEKQSVGMIPVNAVRPIIVELRRKLEILEALCGKATSSDRVEAAGIRAAPSVRPKKTKVAA